MKHIFTTLLCTLFLLALHTNTATAQVNVYTQYQLPPSNELSPLFIGSIGESAIYYGDESKADANKPVVVFVHGFIDLANAWFSPGNDMYERFEERGFRTAFIATTRGEGMWYNGEMFSYMLDDITDHYNVNDVVIVAHSNGGKTSEVAMFEHGKYNKVDRVITLGTPFKGTGVADVAELPGFSWVVGLVGLDGGTSTSTTYYMEGYARPILDNHPDNQPNKFINFGAWGYASGNTIMAPLMTSGGLLLNTMGAGPFNGGNDGVTPYYSSTRPGGAQQWPGYCWGWWCNKQSKHDHLDIVYDDVSFNYIYPWVSGAASLRTNDELIAQEEWNRNPMLASNFEIISSQNGDATNFKITEDTENVTISVLHKDEGNTFSILDEFKTKIATATTSNERLGKGSNSMIVMESAAKGLYELNTDSKEYLAVVNYENGPTLYYDNSKISYGENESVVLHAQIEGASETTRITGIVAHKNDMKGNPVQGETYRIVFEHMGNMKYKYNLPEGLEAGTYAVLINAESESFRRSAVSGFVVKAREIKVVEDATDLLISHFPNPVVESTVIDFNKEFEGEATLQLYDNYGRLVKTENISDLPIGKHKIEWNMTAVNSGTYFLEFRNGEKKTTKQIVVLK